MIEHGEGVIAFKSLVDNALLPTKGYADDAGYDLFVTERRVIEPGETMDIPTGVAVEFPVGTWGMIVGRSSTLRKRGLLINIGIIDYGYRGELFLNTANLGQDAVFIDPGERLGQLLLMNNVSLGLTPVFVDELNPHLRGDKGFGSTGL